MKKKTKKKRKVSNGIGGKSEIKANPKIYDSVFTDFFKIPKNALKLYQRMHPEDTEMKEEDLEIVTLENILLIQPYNDLGFMAGKRRLILVEEQSRWSKNILVRGFLYMAQTLQEYLKDTGQDLYSGELALPVPELYVLYTGNRKGRPAELKLSEEIFGGEKGTVEVIARMLYNEEGGRDVVSQYVKFTQIYKEQVKKYGRTKTAVPETIRICKELVVLRGGREPSSVL